MARAQCGGEKMLVASTEEDLGSPGETLPRDTCQPGWRMLRIWRQGQRNHGEEKTVRTRDGLLPPPPRLRSQTRAPREPRHLRLWSRLNPAPQACCRRRYFRKPARQSDRPVLLCDLPVVKTYLTSVSKKPLRGNRS